MDELQQLANLAEILGALIVVGGLFFAVLQIRNFRQHRREMAAIELFRFFGKPEFNKAFECVLKLPEGLGTRELQQRVPGADHCAMLICTTMENIGVMTFQRIVPFLVVYNLIGSTTVLLWRKLEHWVVDMREDIGNPDLFEWFQWLADRMDEERDPDEPPAFVAHKTWRPARKTNEF